MTGSDTQWPRYQVFHQEEAGRPHINSGTVHASDAEMALQNARDVFVRRPDCVSLWVAKARAIASLTAEELENEGPPTPGGPEGPLETFQVFAKRSQIGSHAHTGPVEATSPEQALELAIEKYGRRDVLVWWVVPEASITRTDARDIDSLFKPAASKLYRDQAFYHTVTLMRKLREAKDESA